MRPELQGTVDLVLTAKRLYAIDLELEDSRGGPIALASEVVGRWYPNPKPADRSARLLMTSTGLIDVAAGEPGFRDSRGQGAYGALYVYEADDESRDSIPLELECDLPGYQPTRTLLQATPLQSELPATRVLLTSDGTEFGDIEVDLRAWKQDDLYPESWGYLVLDASQGSTSCRIELHPRIERRWIVSGVPVGTYEVTFAPPNGVEVRLQDGAGISVEPGETTALVVPRPPLGSLEVELVRPDGSPYEGAFVGALYVPGSRRAFDVSRPGPPYRFRGLPPGSYSLTAMVPEEIQGGTDALGAVAPVRVEPDAVAQLVLHLRD